MKSPFLIKPFVLAVLLFIAGISKASNYYVDPSSTASTQNGAQATPWKTLAQVQSNMNSFQPGDFIYFKKGETFTGALNFTKSGTAAAPITFTTYGTASTPPVFTGTASDLFSFYQRQYIVIDGFKITDFTLDPEDRTQEAIIDIAFSIDGSSYITIKNCDISLVGVAIYMNGSNNTMDRNTIGNLRMIRNTVGGDDDYGANPVVITGSNNNITGNYFKDCWAYSYDYTYDGGAIEMYGAANNNNKIMYNTAVNCDGFMEIGFSGGGATNDNIVAYNKIVNCGELVYISNSGQYATAVNNMQFYNNVIVHTVNQLTLPSSMIGMSASSSTANIINLKNNIFWLTTGIDVARSGKFSGTQLTHEDNIYHLGTGSVLNFTLNATELSTTAALFTSTSGTDPLAWNYVPTTGSPAIDFGQNLGIAKDFAGNTVPAVPNAGILESAGASTLSATSTAGTIACNGGTTTVTVNASNGTAPFTGTGTFTVSAGTYTYTVTDAAGATAITSVTVTQPTALVATTISGTIAVYGGSTTVTVNATGGTSAYTYKLNSGAYQSANTFTGVVAGTYTVTVKDANSCTLVKNLTITQPAAPAPLVAASIAGTISCNGGTATVTVSASGGTTPYSGTGTFTVNAGTYNYSITDAAGVTATTSVNISEPTAIAVALSSGTISVFGGTTTVTANATGGTGTFTYKLNNGSYQAANTFTGVPAGTHSVTVKDVNGCTTAKNIIISQPAAPVQLIAASTASVISCNGGAATVTVTASGGTSPYTGTGTFSLSAGTYTYTVTDAAGVTAITSVTATQPAAIAVSVSSGSIAVFGGTTSVSVNATGGTGTYTYKLNSGNYQSANTFTGVAAGNHSVTVKDANGCTSVKTFSITEPAAPAQLIASSVAGSIDCNGGSATVTVSASGGTAPYTGTGDFNVSAGTYSYTVTDAAGITASTSVTVAQPAAIAVSVSAGTIAVFGGTTSIAVNATGGTGAYTYKLNSGNYQSANTFTGVAAGNHSVTVKDANGCTTVKSFTITQPAAPAALVAVASATTIGCNGGTATVTVSATGGTTPYTGTGSFNVSAGTYTYTVTDAAGVTAIASVNVTQPAAISITIANGTITVFGGTTSVTANATGGTGAYTYKLNSGAYQATNTFANVAAGTHTITVKDANGCTAITTFSLTQPAANTLVVTAVPTVILCNAQISTITVSATGGTAPYTGTGLYTGYAGTYTYTVTDATGAVASTSLTITQPAIIAITVNTGTIVSSGGTTIVTASATGGTAPYNYSMNGTYQAGNSFPNIGAGSYTMSIKDANGCINVKTFVVADPVGQSLKVSLVSKVNATCKGSNTGSIQVIASGGRAPYMYKLNNGRYSTSGLFKNLRTGIYSITAKDATNRTVSLVTYILDGKRLCATGVTSTSKINITAYPNPTADRFSLAIESEKDDAVLVEVMNLNGTKVFEARGSVYKKYTFGENFLSGTYIVRITQGEDVKTTKIIKAR